MFSSLTNMNEKKNKKKEKPVEPVGNIKEPSLEPLSHCYGKVKFLQNIYLLSETVKNSHRYLNKEVARTDNNRKEGGIINAF